MFKRNPYILLLNFLLFMIAIINFNIYLKLIIFFIMFIIKINKTSRLDILSLVTLLILIVNIAYHKWFGLGNILLLGYYLSLMFAYLNKKDLLTFYNYLFRRENKKRSENFIRIMHFKEEFIKAFKTNLRVLGNRNYKKTINYYYYVFRLSLSDTKERLNKKITIYRRKGFFNKKKNRVIILTDFKDILVTLGYILLVVISVRGW